MIAGWVKSKVKRGLFGLNSTRNVPRTKCWTMEKKGETNCFFIPLLFTYLVLPVRSKVISFFHASVASLFGQLSSRTFVTYFRKKNLTNTRARMHLVLLILISSIRKSISTREIRSFLNGYMSISYYLGGVLYSLWRRKNEKKEKKRWKLYSIYTTHFYTLLVTFNIRISIPLVETGGGKRRWCLQAIISTKKSKVFIT